MRIYIVSKKANGIDRFLSQVKLGGNAFSMDPDSGRYEVYSRHRDEHYGENAQVDQICTQEIGKAVEELEQQNTAESLGRASNLQEFMAMRSQSQVEGQAQPYEESADIPVEEEGDEEGYEFEDENDKEEDTENTFTDEEVGELTQINDDDDGEFPVDDVNDHEAANEGSYPNNDLAALYESAQVISNAKRDRILKIVQETLGTDLTDVSDILLMLSETAELKKALSTLLSLLSVEVSMTTVSRDYRVSPKTIRFAPDRSESLDHYRRGIAQAIVSIQKIMSDVEKSQELEKTIKTLETTLEAEKRNTAMQMSRLEDENTGLKAKLSPPSLMPSRFLIFWKSDTERHNFLTVAPGTKNSAVTKENPDAPFEAATKRCGVSSKQGDAFKFTSLESAQNQIKRLNKFGAQADIFKDGVPTLFIARLGLDIVQ